MDIKRALPLLSALSQETRLRLFKLLLEYGSDGAAAGFIGKQLGIAHNTLSFHLSHLSQAGLVASRRQGRSIIYVANCELSTELVSFLAENCCARETGKPSKCAPGDNLKSRRKC